MKTIALALMASAGMLFAQAPAVETQMQSTVIAVEAPGSAAIQYESLAAKYAEKAALYRNRAVNVPQHAKFLEGKHPMAPGTRAHSLYFAAKYEKKALDANRMAAKLHAVAELQSVAAE